MMIVVLCFVVFRRRVNLAFVVTRFAVFPVVMLALSLCTAVLTLR